MKYYSEVTEEIYSSIAELEVAEKKVADEEKRKNALKEEKKARFVEVQEAYKTYRDLAREYEKDYNVILL